MEETLNMIKSAFYKLYYPASYIYRQLEKINSWQEMKYWINLVPPKIATENAYITYASWMREQGMWSVMLNTYIDFPNPKLVDFGCGYGMLASVIHEMGGRYIGIDINPLAIDSCIKTYKNLNTCSFYLSKNHNNFYNKSGNSTLVDWPIQAYGCDALTAISVFTHLQRKDAKKYIDEIHKTLIHNGYFFVTVQLMNPNHRSVNKTFHYDYKLEDGWYTSNPECPEHSIALEYKEFLKLINYKFEVIKKYKGKLTNGKGTFLQDTFVLQKI